jgi:TatD DNase family protein
MIDAHTHLNDPRLLPHADALVTRMRSAGVSGALVVGYDVPSSAAAVELAQRYPGVLRAAVGLHPHDASALDDATLAALRGLAQQPGVVAWGEIGLDYHYDHSPRDVQREAFRRQLAAAAAVGLPVVIHEREAAPDALAILDEEGWPAAGCEWHCCSVTVDLAVQIARRCYVGIAGWITFPKSENLRDLVRAVPLERILLETDAPYLAPVPHRGKSNEPAYVPLVAEAVAALKGVSPADVERITTANILAAFPRWGTAEEVCNG